MSKESERRASKFLSLVLRHRPERIGITLDEGGWVDVDVLLAACAEHGPAISRSLLLDVVAHSDKQRFVLRENRIRANQGHSVAVALDLPAARPPSVLYHGTVAKFVDSIRRDGLRKKTRQHVHLSPDLATATKVGARRGKPVILTIAAGKMHAAGHTFWLSENGVWLVDAVPAEFIGWPVDSEHE